MPTLSDLIAVLERTPAVLRTLLLDLPDAWTTHNYGPSTWSAHQVVGHLLIAERDDWMPRLQRILEHGESKPFDPFPHDATSGSPNEQGGPALTRLLDEFAHLRTQNLLGLRVLNLTPADLSRTGMHPALGRVTAHQLLSTWATHDLHHLRQICLAMAWQCRDDVGPWRAYLNTLHR